MSFAMSRDEREAFLADRHVGVLSVSRPGRAPLTVPVWYSYEPGGLVSVVTDAASRKATLIEAEQRFSLCAQTETAPYQYVTVEGPVAARDDPVDPAERRALAVRYLGEELGDLYVAATDADAASSIVLRMRPEHWLSVDYSKQFG